MDDRDTLEWDDSPVAMASNKLDDIAPSLSYVGSLPPLENKTIITGPIGSGKSLMARALCEKWDLPVYVVDPSFLSKYVGETESTLHRLFQSEGIVVMDHMEVLLPCRSSGTSESVNKVIIQFLIHLDGIHRYNTKFIGMTSDINKVDAAIRRPGRIDMIHLIESVPLSPIFDYYRTLYKVDTKTQEVETAADAHWIVYNDALDLISQSVE